ncbi:isopentenyl-diphosphate delta-isomerase, type 2, fni [Lactococcus cremoris]|nr:isopentenyl-diphosphate delta-isomerase, type 2, fni [Lactococcus cremoris]
MNIIIDLGNVWDALSALGTIGAVGLSLWLATRDEKVDFSVSLSSASGIRDNSRDNLPYLIIESLNKSKFPLTIEEVGFCIDKKDAKKLTVIDQSYLIEGSDKIPQKVEPLETAKYVFEQDKVIELAKKIWGENIEIRAYVRDTTKKTHYSKKIKS